MANALQAIYKWAVPLAVSASVAQAAMYDVKGGTRAVIFDRLSGVRENVVNEGTHFLVPWLQRAIIYDVRTKPRNISTTTGSKDLQMVSLTLRVLHRPEVKMLPRIYQVRSRIDCSIAAARTSFCRRLSADIIYRTSAPTTTSVSSPPLATKSSRPSWRSSTRPS